jgi:hypothetical protein
MNNSVQYNDSHYMLPPSRILIQGSEEYRGALNPGALNHSPSNGRTSENSIDRISNSQTSETELLPALLLTVLCLPWNELPKTRHGLFLEEELLT